MASGTKIVTLHQSLDVPPLSEGRIRLDLFLSRTLSGFSRTKIQEAIEAGQVLVNDKPATSKLQVVEGDRIVVAFAPRTSSSHLEPVPMDLDILFEDESLLVLNKPAGIAVHPGAGDSGATLVHGLLHHCKTLSNLDPSDDDEGFNVLRPGIVHRLDKDTTGVLVVAKTNEAHAHLSKQFHDKVNFRQYVALLDGVLPEGEWVRDSYLHRDARDRTKFASMEVGAFEDRVKEEGVDQLPGHRFARTVFKREACYAGRLSLVSLRLHTGRTHQIRIHARDINAPVVGDPTYGRPFNEKQLSVFPGELRALLLKTKRQMLHAWVLGFNHPITKTWVQFEAPLPEDFSQIIKLLEEPVLP